MTSFVEFMISFIDMMDCQWYVCTLEWPYDSACMIAEDVIAQNGLGEGPRVVVTICWSYWFLTRDPGSSERVNQLGQCFGRAQCQGLNLKGPYEKILVPRSWEVLMLVWNQVDWSLWHFDLCLSQQRCQTMLWCDTPNLNCTSSTSTMSTI